MYELCNWYDSHFLDYVFLNSSLQSVWRLGCQKL